MTKPSLPELLHAAVTAVGGTERPGQVTMAESVVETATLALQRQLVERDLPRTVDALHPLLRRRPEFAMLKGRSNYLCLHRLHEGVPQEDAEAGEAGLFDPFEAAEPTSKLG